MIAASSALALLALSIGLGAAPAWSLARSAAAQILDREAAIRAVLPPDRSPPERREVPR